MTRAATGERYRRLGRDWLSIVTERNDRPSPLSQHERTARLRLQIGVDLSARRRPIRADLELVEPDADGNVGIEIPAPLSMRPRPDFTFTDNAGIRWHRATDGDLHKAQAETRSVD